jgi:hypothetical protein
MGHVHSNRHILPIPQASDYIGRMVATTCLTSFFTGLFLGFGFGFGFGFGGLGLEQEQELTGR